MVGPTGTYPSTKGDKFSWFGEWVLSCGGWATDKSSFAVQGMNMHWLTGTWNSHIITIYKLQSMDSRPPSPQVPKSSSPRVRSAFLAGSQKILHGQIWTGSSEVAGMAYGSCAKSLASQSSPAPLGDQKQENPWFIGGHTYLEKRDLFMMFNHCCRWCPNAVCCL